MPNSNCNFAPKIIKLRYSPKNIKLVCTKPCLKPKTSDKNLKPTVEHVPAINNVAVAIITVGVKTVVWCYGIIDPERKSEDILWEIYY